MGWPAAAADIGSCCLYGGVWIAAALITDLCSIAWVILFAHSPVEGPRGCVVCRVKEEAALRLACRPGDVLVQINWAKRWHHHASQIAWEDSL